MSDPSQGETSPSPQPPRVSPPSDGFHCPFKRVPRSTPNNTSRWDQKPPGAPAARPL